MKVHNHRYIEYQFNEHRLYLSLGLLISYLHIQLITELLNHTIIVFKFMRNFYLVSHLLGTGMAALVHIPIYSTLVFLIAYPHQQLFPFSVWSLYSSKWDLLGHCDFRVHFFGDEWCCQILLPKVGWLLTTCRVKFTSWKQLNKAFTKSCPPFSESGFPHHPITAMLLFLPWSLPLFVIPGAVKVHCSRPGLLSTELQRSSPCFRLPTNAIKIAFPNWPIHHHCLLSS